MFIEETLYAEIVQLIPILCVDLVVMDRAGRILLIKRKNQPASNQWWFPGGRVLFGELRSDAARRKLWQECGLCQIESLKELQTFDWIFSVEGGRRVHSVTTLFKVVVDSDKKITLDEQSIDARWDYPKSWTLMGLDPKVMQGLAVLFAV